MINKKTDRHELYHWIKMYCKQKWAFPIKDCNLSRNALKLHLHLDRGLHD